MCIPRRSVSRSDFDRKKKLNTQEYCARYKEVICLGNIKSNN